MRQWYLIDALVPGHRAAYLGKCFATLAKIREACGTYCTITGNHVIIWGKP